MRQHLRADEWQELLTLGRLETIGDDRRDKGLALAALGIMSSMGAKLDGFDASKLLPNRREQTVDEQFQQFLTYSQQRNAKWQNQSAP